METALVIGLLCIGAVFGGLIVAAWQSDTHRAWVEDGILHFDGPLAAEDIARLKELWTLHPGAPWRRDDA